MQIHLFFNLFYSKKSNEESLVLISLLFKLLSYCYFFIYRDNSFNNSFLPDLIARLIYSSSVTQSLSTDCDNSYKLLLRIH